MKILSSDALVNILRQIKNIVAVVVSAILSIAFSIFVTALLYELIIGLIELSKTNQVIASSILAGLFTVIALTLGKLLDNHLKNSSDKKERYINAYTKVLDLLNTNIAKVSIINSKDEFLKETIIAINGISRELILYAPDYVLSRWIVIVNRHKNILLNSSTIEEIKEYYKNNIISDIEKFMVFVREQISSKNSRLKKARISDLYY